MRFVFIGLILLMTLHCTAQVREVRSNIEKDKSERSTSTSYGRTGSTPSYSPPDLGEGFAAFLLGNLFYYSAYGVYRAAHFGQTQMHYRRPEHPETFSFEADLMAGFDFENNAMMLSPSVRVNRGLFATDLRFLATDDVTGKLHTLDWQVLKLRFPLRNVKMEYGIGFSHLFSPSKTYFDQSAGLDWCFLNRRATLQGEYRWSQKSSLGARYRQEASVKAHYQVARSGRFHFAPSMGFTWQDYFGTTQFRFFQIGLTVLCF